MSLKTRPMWFFDRKVTFLFQILYLVLNSARGQQSFARSERDYGSCLTPLKVWGKCTSLRYCPEVLTLFIKLSKSQATSYSSELQRLCGHRVTLDQYPVVSNLKEHY